MADIKKTIKGLKSCTGSDDCAGHTCPYWDFNEDIGCRIKVEMDALELLKEQDSRIKKYEYMFDFLGIGFREWATLIIDGEAEATCEVDKYKRETVIRFKHI